MLYDAVKPLLFSMAPERVHETAIAGLHLTQQLGLARLLHARYDVTDQRLETELFGVRFPNPVGVAAGFDKNAKAPNALAGFGFGHVEIGGVTAEGQPGNPAPRLFRLPEDDALINRLGFNNDGADRIGARLASTDQTVPVGVNIGKSKRTPLDHAPADYEYTYERLADAGDYFVVNVSSPNTPGLRTLQQGEQLRGILRRLTAVGAGPLLVKLSPDLSLAAVDELVEIAAEFDLDGIIATNTTTERPESLAAPSRQETGGLSGEPIESRATEMVRHVAGQTELPVIGVGGVSDAEGAYAKIRAGASLVQLYTAFVYEGPRVAAQINKGLLDRLERDGYESIEEAVGADL
jgi:dihydroorotate dehydrogenase